MSEDDPDGNTPFLSRRRALTTAGALGVGAITVPGFAKANRSSGTSEELHAEKNPADWDAEEVELDVVKGDTQKVVELDEDDISEVGLRPQDIRHQIGCDPTGTFCLSLGFALRTWYVGVNVYINGVSIYGGGFGRDDGFYQISTKYKGLGITIGLGGAWEGGTDVRIDVNAELCAGPACVSHTESINL